MVAPIPGPRGHWLLGSLREFQRDKLGFLRDCAQTYGDIFQFRAGPTRIVVVNDVDEVRKLLIDDAARFQKSKLTRAIFGRILGNGLLVSEGEDHRRQRRLCQPAFDSKRLKSYGDVAVRHAELTCSSWVAPSEVDVESDMGRITLGVVAETLFGASVANASDTVIQSMSELQRAGSELMNSGFVPPAWLPTRKNRLLKRASAEMQRVLEAIVEERRREAGDRGDLLSMMLMARDEDGGEMRAHQLYDEARTLFLAGFETTANALTWTWYFLAKNPTARSQLEQQLDATIGDRTPAVGDLEALPYVSMVFKEALRTCCPIWAFNRSPIEPTGILGHQVEPKDVIIISPYLLHRKREYFPDPDRFEPERFAPESAAKIPKMAYLPFGAGPRICIGARLATLEAELVIATVAQRFRLLVPESYVADLEVNLSIRPKHGLKMQLERRRS